MPLVHYWAAGFASRLAIGVADVERKPMWLTGRSDAQGCIIHAETEILGAAILPRLVPAFNPLDAILTIEQEPEFAFIPYTYTQSDGVLRITAIPYIIHMRRSVLPDWYSPATEPTR